MKPNLAKRAQTALSRHRVIIFGLSVGLAVWLGDTVGKKFKEAVDQMPVTTMASVLTAKMNQLPPTDLAELKRISAIFAEAAPLVEGNLTKEQAATSFTIKVPVEPEVKPGAEVNIVKVNPIDLNMLARIITLTATSPGGATLNNQYVEVGKPLDFLPSMTSSNKIRPAILESITNDGVVLFDPVEKKRVSITGVQ